MTALRVTRWTDEEFLARRAEWQSLLGVSDVDPLFMSWDWISTWWRHHREALQAQLCVLAVYQPNGELAGIAPFHAHRATHRGMLSARRLELLGNAWRNPAVVFSEYLDLIADARFRDDVCEAVGSWLRENSTWDELVLCNLRDDSVAARLGGSLSGAAYLRPVESMLGWSIALPQSFDSFVTRLSSNTRRKVVHQREKLVGATFVVIGAVDRAAALERLDNFVAGRFGAPAPGDSRTRARFHAEIVENWADAGEVHITELRAAGKCVSVMFNVRRGGTEYYLQSGFDASHARGLSPGLLHLGYAIEAACRDGIRDFDFLAGRGLHRDYKRDFAAHSVPLETLHIVRKPALRTFFRVIDRLRGRTSQKTEPGD
jgi:CelD/BcsL family acetyltransferase involved in cellulose biosynthesis